MNNDRRQEALRVRVEAAKLAAGRVHPRHEANGDEQKFRRKNGEKNEPSYLASFTKGLPHEYDTGLVCNSDDFQQFVKGIDSGDPRDFRDTPLGPDGNDVCPDWKSTIAQNINKDKPKEKKSLLRFVLGKAKVRAILSIWKARTPGPSPCRLHRLWVVTN